jgi:hypothetical protein
VEHPADPAAATLWPDVELHELEVSRSESTSAQATLAAFGDDQRPGDGLTPINDGGSILGEGSRLGGPLRW